MRYLLFLLLSLGTISAIAQDYAFNRDFVKGSLTFKDSTKKTGYLKWFPNQNEKLRFREYENAYIKKYSPEDLLGFTTGRLKFVSLFNLEVYGENYAFLGKTSKVKHTFGQLLDSGHYNIYLVLITGYDAINGVIQTYRNFYFDKGTDSSYQSAAYPFAIRMWNKKYEKAKKDLITFFKDYPDIIEKIKSYKQQDDFLEIIELMKNSN